MKIVKLITITLMVILITITAYGRQITIASWKIDNLKQKVGSRCLSCRQRDDIKLLARYAAELNADIIAFQGVENQTAAEYIFPSDQYNLYFPLTDHPEQAGFAVRDDLSVDQTFSFSHLAVGGRSSRGTDITVTVDGQKIRMLSVDLYDGCWHNDIDSEMDACGVLKYQMGIIKHWINMRDHEGIPFVIMGNFNRMFDFPGDNSWREIDNDYFSSIADGDLLRVTRGRESDCLVGKKYPQYIDHIVLNKQASEWIVPDSFRQVVYSERGGFRERLSSHCPIVVVIDIP